MERSLGASALLDASWTIPWLDHGVFPYWPEAARIGDLEVFLEWLTVQDGHRAALVLTHAREFEKVHRLVTRELTRDKSAKIYRRDPPSNSAVSWQVRRSSSEGDTAGGSPPQGRSRSRGSQSIAAIASDSSRPGSSEGSEGGGKKQGVGIRTRRRLCRSGSADVATLSSSLRRRASKLPDGNSSSSAMVGGGRNFTQSWPPSSRRRNTTTASMADPPPLRSCRRALVSSPKLQVARPTRETSRTAATVAHGSRQQQQSILVAPQPRRLARQWNVGRMDPSATNYSAYPSGGGEHHAIEPVALQGGRPAGRISTKSAPRRTTAAAASAAPSAGAVPPPPPATPASYVPAPSSSSTGRSSTKSRGRGKSGRGSGIPPPHPRVSRSSPLAGPESRMVSRRVPPSLPNSGGGGTNSSGGGAGGGSRRPPAASGAARERSIRVDRGDSRHRGGDIDRTAPSLKHAIEDSSAVSSTPARISGDETEQVIAGERPPPSTEEAVVSGSSNAKRRPPVVVVPCPSPEQQITINTRRASSLEDFESEGVRSDEPQETESRLFMRDPVSLRNFWFDPKTRAAEWEGGGAMEDAPGGMGLGLLSVEERDRLAKKFERRQRRGRRGTDAGAEGEGVVLGGGRVGGGGGGRGEGLREHVLRKLTLEGSSGGAGVEQKVVAAVVGGLVPEALKSA